MSLKLIRNATVLPFTASPNGPVDLTPQLADVLVQDDRIVEVAPHIEAAADEVFDADHHLLIPGFVDAHTHTTLGILEKCGYEALPYGESYLDADLKRGLDQTEWLSNGDWVALFRSLHDNWHGKAERLTLMLAPSAPQWVTPDLMHQIAELSESLDLPIHTHMLETKTQAVTGPEFYGPGNSVVSYAKRHGILTHRTAIAHGIWLTDRDVELIAEAGATVVHNVVSNHRLCSGIAPIRQLMDAGVNIALGSDGMSSNDSFNMFDVLKMAGQVHSVTHPDYSRYPRARDVLKWGTYGGARSALLQDQMSAIAPGLKADCVLYDLNTTSFIPRGDLPIHLVYAEHGQSIRKIFINGQLVVEDGSVLTVDESALLRELQDLLAEYEPERAESTARPSA